MHRLTGFIYSELTSFRVAPFWRHQLGGTHWRALTCAHAEPHMCARSLTLLPGAASAIVFCAEKHPSNDLQTLRRTERDARAGQEGSVPCVRARARAHP